MSLHYCRGVVVCLYLCSCVMRMDLDTQQQARTQTHLSSNDASHTKPGSFSVVKVAAVAAVPRSIARVDWLVPRKPITLFHTLTRPQSLSDSNPRFLTGGINLHASATSWSISRPRRLRPLFCKRARCFRIASPPLAHPSHSFCADSCPSPFFSAAACAEHESIPPCLSTLTFALIL